MVSNINKNGIIPGFVTNQNIKNESNKAEKNTPNPINKIEVQKVAQDQYNIDIDKTARALARNLLNL